MTGVANRVEALLERGVRIRAGEARALLLAFAYFFFLLASYYVLRPLRDEMGIQGGIRNLPWLFTATFAAMALAVPLFGALVARFPRRRIVPVAYRFFGLNILIFFALLSLMDDTAWVARAFFVWVSVFNLFVVSVFWSLMADLFTSEQGKRLFGFVAAGGTLGALAGPAVTAALAQPLGPVNLLLVSAAALEAALLCARRLFREASDGATPPAGNEAGDEAGAEAIGGGILAGITEVLRSPYLLGISLYMVLYTTTSTFLYFLQADIVAGAFDDPAERTRLFAMIDLLVGVLTILIQCFVTGRFMARFGVGWALALLPVVSLVGFVALAWAPAVGLLVAFQGTRRAANFAVSRPAREVLYTVVSRERKYKAKNVVDTLVYRGGDAASGWAFAGLAGIGLGLSAMALVAAPLAALWLWLALALGGRQKRLAETVAAAQA